MTVVLDSGGVSGLAGRRARLAELRQRGVWPPIVPAIVLTEVLTGDHRRDVAANRLLQVCQIRPVIEDIAREAARLRTGTGRAGTISAVDAVVAATALRVTEPVVLTSDPDDLLALVEKSGVSVVVSGPELAPGAYPPPRDTTWRGQMGRLDGKVAIVTGGARGQGGAEAALFRAEGAEVVITDVLADAGRAHAEAIGATFIAHDVRSEEEWAEVVRQTTGRHGRLDVLVNNAGIFRRGKLLDTSLDDYRTMIDINQIGVFLGMKAVGPTMVAQQSGSIVNISSIAGLLSAPNAFAYGASKFTVRGMTKTAAVELARANIRVNSIHPGLIDTDMMTEVTSGDATRHDRLTTIVPLRRMAEAEEVASLALFLASDESRYCTGSEFVIDGGVTIT